MRTNKGNAWPLIYVDKNPLHLAFLKEVNLVPVGIG